MQRRHFLSLAAAVGLTGLVPLLTHEGEAVAADGDMKYFIIITANGGWDPRFHFDPSTDPGTNRIYTDIGSAGNIQYATWEPAPGQYGVQEDSMDHQYMMSPGAFIEKHGSRFTVINGLDTATNNHDTGKRTMNSGVNPQGYPSLGALVAATHGATLPMAYYSGGAYDATAGLVALTRINSARSAERIAKPNIVNPGREEEQSYHTPETWQRIRAAQKSRLEELEARQHLPKLKASIADLRKARSTDNLLERLVLPESEVDLPFGDLEGMLRQAQIAIAGFKSGLTASANITLGGFDTHGSHDSDHPNKLGKLFYGIDWILAELAAAGLSDKAYVVVVSDFARTPLYNGDNGNSGKDHWPVTTAMVTGPGVEGNRVIGSTDAEQLAVPVNPSTLQASADGVRITPGNFHMALRKLAGVDPGLSGRFPLQGDELPLFG